MPSLGSDMEDGTLIEWLIQPGQPVRRGDIIAVVETEKGAIEIEIFEDGTLATQLVTIGTTVPVGAPLAEIVGGLTPADAATGTSAGNRRGSTGHSSARRGASGRATGGDATANGRTQSHHRHT